MAKPDLLLLYSLMLQSRLFEEAVKGIYAEGWISGEMHLGIGEEGIVAGVLAHLIEGDALALDHRSTPPLIMRGVDPILILRELLGYEDGLCAGQGGHMHLFSRRHLAAASGIVGSSGPAAVGFALAGSYLRPGTLAVAFFGEGALNQGMMMESLNLAKVWDLPVLFVCKDDGWAITTSSEKSMGSSITGKIRGFGLEIMEVDGRNALEVSQSAGILMKGIRRGDGPGFLLANCRRPDGHMLGDQLLRLGRGEERADLMGIVRSLTRFKGDSLSGRVGNARYMTDLMGQFATEHEFTNHDPLVRARAALIKDDLGRLEAVENKVTKLMADTVSTVMSQIPGKEKQNG